MKDQQTPRLFSSYVALQSFLIGLMPFFFPTYLWSQGMSLPLLMVFVVLTATGYLLMMGLWRPLQMRIGLKGIMVLSFVLELLLVGCLLGDLAQTFWMMGLLNGFFNGAFWLTQRVLFLSYIRPDDSGRRFGALQILVLIAVQLGVFFGGAILQYAGIPALWGVSLLMALLSLAILRMVSKGYDWPSLESQVQAPALSEYWSFQDVFGSRTAFLVDGPLLYLETFFWLITLFTIVRDNFFQLGVLVIGLGLSFAVVFWMLKNLIDRLPVQQIYVSGVVLYIGSWLLRSQVHIVLDSYHVGVMVLCVSFMTFFFRLTFNKRFFDQAYHRQQEKFQYLFIKSAWSQFTMLVFFVGVVGLVISGVLVVEDHELLSKLYLFAALLSMGYLFYRSFHVQKMCHSGALRDTGSSLR